MTKPKAARANQPSFREPDHEGASAALKLMAQRPKIISPEELVRKDYDTLFLCLKGGYTYTEIAEVYSDHNIKVTPAKLKIEFEKRQNQQQQEQQEAPLEVTTSSSTVGKPVKRSDSEANSTAAA